MLGYRRKMKEGFWTPRRYGSRIVPRSRTWASTRSHSSPSVWSGKILDFPLALLGESMGRKGDLALLSRMCKSLSFSLYLGVFKLELAPFLPFATGRRPSSPFSGKLRQPVKASKWLYAALKLGPMVSCTDDASARPRSLADACSEHHGCGERAWDAWL